MPLTAASARTVVPWRAAMWLSVSPGAMVTGPPVAGADETAGAEAPGRFRRRPATIAFGFVIPFAAASARTVVPCRAASSLSVSPGCTVIAPRAAEAVTRRAAMAARIHPKTRIQVPPRIANRREFRRFCRLL